MENQDKIDIINRYIAGNFKLNKYLGFSSFYEAREVAIVLGKFYTLYIKSKSKINVSKEEREAFLVNELIKCSDSIEKIKMNYCLGEIYLLKDKSKAEVYFNKVLSNNENGDEILDLKYMSQYYIKKLKNIDYTNLIDVENLIGYEINFNIFERHKYKKKAYKSEFMANLAFWLYKKCPKYKDVDELICNYFENNNSWHILMHCQVLGYKNTKDIKYVNKYLNYLNKVDKIDSKEQSDALYILNSINIYENMGVWSKIVKKVYTIIDKNESEKLLSEIDMRLQNTRMFTGEFEEEPEIIDTLSMIYNDISRYKGKYQFINKYEEKITKYLLYSSSQNNIHEKKYEAYTKLSAINKFSNKEDISISTALKHQLDIKLLPINGYYVNENYPYESLLDNLGYILDEYNLFNNIKKYYLDNKAIESKIMLYGMFSTGKSSFINSLIGKHVLEEGDLPTTSTFTLVGSKRDKGLEEKIKYSIPTNNVIVDNGFFKINNILLIDTPGFEDLDSKQGNLSTDNASICDKFIVLLDASRPLTGSEYNRIKQLSEEISSSEFLFVLNKVDYIDEEEDSIDEIVEDVSIKLKKIVGDNVRIFPYSSVMVNKGDLELRKNIQNEIINFIYLDKAKSRLDVISDTINYSKLEVKKAIGDEINTIEKKIDVFNQALANTRNISELLAEEGNHYKNNIKLSLEKLKEDMDNYIYENINDIYKNMTNIVNECGDMNTVHDEVRFRLRVLVNNWLEKDYKYDINKNLNRFLSDLRNYIEKQNSIIKNLVSTACSTCILSKTCNKRCFENNVTSDVLLSQLSNISKIILGVINIDDEFYINNFDMGIDNPVLGGISRGFSKLFNGEQETLQKYKSTILEQFQRSANRTYEYFINNNFKINMLLQIIEYVLYEGNYTIDNQYDDYIENFDDINLEILTMNIEQIHKCNNSIKEVYNDINNIKLDNIEKQNQLKIKINNILDEISMLNIDILKYEEQINNHIIYSEDKLLIV